MKDYENGKQNSRGEQWKKREEMSKIRDKWGMVNGDGKNVQEVNHEPEGECIVEELA
jgi:hypothetical protein